MTTNVNTSNDVDESNRNSDMMDIDKVGIADEEGQKQSINDRSNLAGPMTSMVCIHFIIWSDINATINERAPIYLDDLLQVLSTNNADFDNEMDKLQELAENQFLNLYICIINQNEKSFYYLNANAVEGSQQWPRTCLVFDKHTGSFYPFYIRDENNKYHTIFPANDTSTLRLFEDLVYSYNWPSDGEEIQQSPGQDNSIADQHIVEEHIPTVIDSRSIVNANNQSECILKASGICNLLVKNVQSLIPCVESQLDSLNFSFKSSEYQLNATDLTSPEAANKALQKQLQFLWKFSELIDESLKTSRITPTSMEITESITQIPNTALNNHERNTLSNVLIITEQSLTLNAQSTIFTNTSQMSITTHNVNETIKLSKLESINQPTRHRRHRNLQDLCDNHCPAVQVEGAGQGTSFQFKLPNNINDYKQEFYLGAHATTYDKKEHDQRMVVPINTLVRKERNLKTNDLSCLTFFNKENTSDEFDVITKGTFSKINPDELKILLKDWTFKTVNLYHDEKITKKLIENKKLKWSRLMFAIYIKLSGGQFERISPPIFSDLMKEIIGPQSINITTVFPNRLCERGGQMIFIPLGDLVEKKDHICVRCNDKDLNKNKFQISEKILSFESLASNQGQKDLHVTVNYLNTSNEPITFKLPYHCHSSILCLFKYEKNEFVFVDDHPEPCGVLNED